MTDKPRRMSIHRAANRLEALIRRKGSTDDREAMMLLRRNLMESPLEVTEYPASDLNLIKEAIHTHWGKCVDHCKTCWTCQAWDQFNALLGTKRPSNAKLWRSYACPTCRARPGKYCNILPGRPTTTIHPERIKKYVRFAQAKQRKADKAPDFDLDLELGAVSRNRPYPRDEDC